MERGAGQGAGPLGINIEWTCDRSGLGLKQVESGVGTMDREVVTAGPVAG